MFMFTMNDDYDDENSELNHSNEDVEDHSDGEEEFLEIMSARMYLLQPLFISKFQKQDHVPSSSYFAYKW